MRKGIPVRCLVVSAVIVDDGEPARTLLLKRASDYLRGCWTYVAGSIEAGESAPEAILREIREETGLAVERLYSTDFCEQFYHRDLECISVVPAFVARVAAGAQVTLNREHSAFRWVTFQEAREMLSFGGQRRLYDQVYREFVLRSPPEALRLET